MFLRRALPLTITTDLINLLAAASIARCIANVSNDYGFHSSVDTDKAKELSKKTITKLLTPMYGDHVNNHLRSSGMPTLQQLREEEGFLDNYHKLLLAPPFDHNALSRNVSRDYTIALLFCYEYLKHGPGFSMTEVLSAESEDMKHWVAVFRGWIEQSQSEAFRKANPDFRIEQMLRNVGGVLALDGYPDATTRQVAEHLKDRIVGDIVRWEIQDDIDQYEILGQTVWASWDSATNDYQSAAVQAVNNVRETTKVVPTFTRVPAPTQVTSTFGESVDQYMTAFWGTSLFKARAGNRVRSQWLRPNMFGGCFRPGTQVIVASGTKNIEDLVEGDRVLTRGGAEPQWGLCSDETVRQPATVGDGGGDGDRVQLYGFNGERPFASANHVFHTTTGLRALDPDGARRENPWLEVGYLRVGHQLIRTETGASYGPVTVESIGSEEADCSHIHGVHLREGLRSYHANGYLVHLNYPDITAKSISDTLRAVEPAEKMNMLAQFRELQPLFERFGGSTLMDALEGQLLDSYTSKNPLVLVSVPANNAKLRPHVKQLHWKWNLQDDGEEPTAHPESVFPSVSVFEGVLAVDGVYCEAAMLKDRTLAWSRQVSGTESGGGTGDCCWEHGVLYLDDALMIAQGSVFYGSDAESFDEAQARRVIAYPTQKTLPPALVAENLVTDPRAQVLLGGSSGGAVGPMALSKAGTFSVSELDAAAGKPTVMLSLPSNADEHPWAPSMDMGMMSSMSININMASMNPGVTTASSPATGEAWEHLDTYALAYDKSEWSDKDASVQDSAPYLDVTTAMHGESKIFASRIPLIDQIRDAAYAQAQTSHNFARVDEFYTCFHTIHPVSHNTVYEFRCTRPQLIAQQADGWDPARPSYENLTFNNLGLTGVTLPFVFSVMRIELGSDAMDVTGIVRKFDPKMLGEEGKRHRVLGEWTDTPTIAVRSILASSTAGSFVGAPITLMATAHTEVSPKLYAMATVAAAQPVTQDERAGAKQLSEMKMPSELQDQTQRLIYRVMLYHMSDHDREMFVGVSKPLVSDDGGDTVPAELGPNLEAGLRTWVTDKYTKAWLAQRISTIADTNKDAFRKQLSVGQRKKLRYWWDGKGPSCMSKDDYYSRLNEKAAQFTLLRLLPQLRNYKNDPSMGTTSAGRGKVATTGLNGGKRWAAALYNMFGIGPALNQMVQTLGSASNSALDPIAIAVKGAGWTDAERPLCMRLTENVRKKCTQLRINMPYVGSSYDPVIQDEYQFLHDAMKQLWVNLLEGKEGFGDEITKKVRDDMQNLMDEIGVDKSWEASKKAQFGVEFLEQTIRTGAAISRANTQFSLGTKIGETWAGFRGKGAVAAVAVADYSTTATLKNIKDEVKAAKIKAFAYSSMVISTLGLYIMTAITAFKGWTSLSPADRAKLVLGAVQQAVFTLKSGGQAFKSILDFRAGKQRFLAAAAAEAATTTDMKIAEEEMADFFGEENLIDPEMRLNEKVNSLGKSEFLEFEARETRIELERYKERATVETIEQKEQLAPLSEDGGVSELGTGSADGSAKYNWKANMFQSAMVIIGAAIVVAMCFALYQNWGRQNWTDRIMGIANIAVQALSVIVEGVALFVDFGFTIVSTTITSSIMAVCAWAGPILAIVGLVLMIVAMIIMAVKPRPLTDTEQWMVDKGFPFVDKTLSDPPGSQLTWEFSSDRFAANSASQRLDITGKNISSENVSIIRAFTNITTGTSKSSLFADDAFQESSETGTATGRFSLEASSDAVKKALEFKYVVGTPSYGDVHSETKETDKQTPYTLSVHPVQGTTVDIQGNEKPGSITLKPGEWLRIVLQGKTGDKYANGFYLEVREDWEDGDSVASAQYINRS
ncbi:hypothetical protein ColKHC_09044 [Colletotrichum higginsianum]|nr:hypothetical protein ColKHC_09044 [Colletotrichum higginsianum]